MENVLINGICIFNLYLISIKFKFDSSCSSSNQKTLQIRITKTNLLNENSYF